MLLVNIITWKNTTLCSLYYMIVVSICILHVCVYFVCGLERVNRGGGGGGHSPRIFVGMCHGKVKYGGLRSELECENEGHRSKLECENGGLWNLL